VFAVIHYEFNGSNRRQRAANAPVADDSIADPDVESHVVKRGKMIASERSGAADTTCLKRSKWLRRSSSQPLDVPLEAEQFCFQASRSFSEAAANPYLNWWSPSA
jgi:hypothetical protein